MNLARITSPRDLDGLSERELEALAQELRGTILDTVSRGGGHLSSNLGVVELTLALHRAFDFPKDKLVFDVGHQCYAHKLLTGRYEKFSTLRTTGGLSGFPRMDESPYDAFGAGHASTSISAALGLARARDLKGEKHHVVAVVGDGALTGGMCYEALCDAGSRKTRLIVVLNDNDMSISRSVGAVSNYLTHMRVSKGWLDLKKTVARTLLHSPVAAKRLHAAFLRAKNMIRNVFVRDRLFSAMGFHYFGPVDGHDIKGLESIFRRVQLIDEPVLVHVVTEKGKGYELAEMNPERLHGTPPFRPEDGLPARSAHGRSMGECACRELLLAAQTDPRLVVVTAAMTEGTGMHSFFARHPDRLFDVGICEEHAVTLAAGLAAGGMRPYVAIYNTFLQRAYDQILIDVCEQKLPVTFLADRTALGEDGPTHHGVFGGAVFTPMPGMRALYPRDCEELKQMLRYAALRKDGPLVILYPRAERCVENMPAFPPFEIGVWPRARAGADAALLALGDMLGAALETADILNEKGVKLSVYSVTCVKPADESTLHSLSGTPYFTLEEQQEIGGFGAYVAEICAQRALTPPRHIFALPDAFTPHGARRELLERAGLSPRALADEILRSLGGKA